jgi:hypothetical protein
MACSLPRPRWPRPLEEFRPQSHYYASLLIRHGESVKVVQARLGTRTRLRLSIPTRTSGPTPRIERAPRSTTFSDLPRQPRVRTPPIASKRPAQSTSRTEPRLSADSPPPVRGAEPYSGLTHCSLPASPPGLSVWTPAIALAIAATASRVRACLEGRRISPAWVIP